MKDLEIKHRINYCILINCLEFLEIKKNFNQSIISWLNGSGVIGWSWVYWDISNILFFNIYEAMYRTKSSKIKVKYQDHLFKFVKRLVLYFWFCSCCLKLSFILCFSSFSCFCKSIITFFWSIWFILFTVLISFKVSIS